MNGDLTGVHLQAGSGLIDRALALLASGPCATERVAAEVLALRGNPAAAASAVFALLGSDARFHVDASGVWSLSAPPAAEPRGGLRMQEWVVVDVETTGGSPDRGHRVIEVAAVHISGGEVREAYSSLVNPGFPIPRMITSITGINDAMVSGAPRFRDIAGELNEVLAGRVFVGHNATFDWRFVSAEMERCVHRGLAGQKLCTLRIARRLLPHLPSRALGALATYFGIEMEAHHRALDDAVATARLLLCLLDQLEERGVDDWDALNAFFREPAPRRRRTARPRWMDAS